MKSTNEVSKCLVKFRGRSFRGGNFFAEQDAVADALGAYLDGTGFDLRAADIKTDDAGRCGVGDHKRTALRPITRRDERGEIVGEFNSQSDKPLNFFALRAKLINAHHPPRTDKP